ncbi:molybdate ABC transporter substrate-binding protein [Blastopirellula retiformator]|uniref:Molybdate-binding periplasmic protein n=1 Tax=Blastopirellula retiformator TaxID=2527970 RepID=A0A5C5V8I4_9BACT|nr:molybdate ABC transporter substrate-binding protein [Blastopirellula retiformator]TWT34273.1 Molybdate-binding periplasmic protein precursor [Blastopirellula retiformator]
MSGVGRWAMGGASCLIMGLLCSCGPVIDSARQPRRITVLAAASLTDAIEQVADAWSRQSGNVARISVGPSNALSQQILAGAPADVYLSANERWADVLVEQGRVEKQVPLLSNRLVWIIPHENHAGIASPDEITTKATRVALAGENVPAGIYADQALRTAGLLDQFEGRIVRGNDVRTTLAYVARGEVDAGIVYATDAAATDQVVTLAELDPESYDAIRYPAMVLKGADEGAEAFFDFLQSPTASEIFQRHHFVVLTAQVGEIDDAR